MATTSVGQPFGIVTSKDQASAITDSKTNAGQFYITKTNSSNTGAAGNTEGNGSDAMALTMNGNVLRGISKTDASNLSNLSAALIKLNNLGAVYQYKGSVTASGLLALTSVKQGYVYNVSESITIDGNTYPKNTNFAAIKDGAGNTSGIWDSLGGITGTASLDSSDSASMKIVQDWVFQGKGTITLNESTYDIETKTFKISTNSTNGIGIPAQIDINLSTGLTSNGKQIFVDVVSLTGTNLHNKLGVLYLDVNKLSGTTADKNKYYYSKGGIYFAETTKSGQKEINITNASITTTNNYMKLRCGSGLAFKEGYEDIANESSTILGHDGKYYVSVDGQAIKYNSDGKIGFKYNDTPFTINSSGLDLRLPDSNGTTTLTNLPLSTVALLKVDDSNGVCVDIKALTNIVKLIMAAQ